MSFYMIKTILGWLFLFMGIAAVTSMLTIMGKQEKKMPAPKLRKIHRGAGLVFFVLMLVNAFLGFRFWVISGDALSTRAVLHAVLAIALVIILFLKVAIVKVYKNLLRYAPTLGMIVFSLAFVVFVVSGGYFSARSLISTQKEPGQKIISAPGPLGRAEIGAELYMEKCGSCHYADKEEALFGPGLANLLKNETLPVSGRPATMENVRSQILAPFRSMPAFTDFTEQELADLLAYLRTL
jgi:hypothetical protein